MAIKSIVKLFILFSVIQGFKFQTSLPGEPCTNEEVIAIRAANQERYDNHVEEASSAIEQRLQDAESSIGKPDETSEKTIQQIREYIESLKPSICTKELQLQVDVKLAKLDASQLKCATNSEKSKTSITTKGRSDLLKLQGTKLKVAYVLQKCGNPLKVVGDCSTVEACAQQLVASLIVKVDSTVTKTGASIDKAILEQENCLSGVVIQALGIQAQVKKILLQCKLQEPANKPSEETPSEPSNSQSNENSANQSNGEEAHPGNGEEAAPGNGEEAAPGNGEEAAPGNGGEAAPGNGEEAAPGNGEQQGSNQSQDGQAPGSDQPNKSVEGGSAASENSSNGGQPEESNGEPQE